MTVTDLGGFAFAQLASSLILPAAATGPSRYLYDLGRLSEARIFAAQGRALGVFGNDDVSRFLSDTDRVIDDHHAAEGSEQLPRLLNAKQLTELWEPQEFDAEAYRYFDRTLSLRTYLDTSVAFDNFHALLLFADDDTWDTAREEARTINIEHLKEGGDDQPGSAFINGAFNASYACTDAFSLLTGDTREFAPPWPGLTSDTEPLPHTRYRLANLSISRWAEAPGRGTLDSISDEPYSLWSPELGARVVTRGISSLLLSTLLEWASAPQRRMPPSAPASDEFWSYRAVWHAPLMRDVGAYRRNLALGVPWAALLWRLAPMDDRTLDRYDEAVDLTLAFLQAALPDAPIV